MNNFTQESNPKRLHSPLLDGPTSKENKTKGKRTYYNPNEEQNKIESIDYTLDTAIFNNKTEKPFLENKSKINKKLIGTLEFFLKATIVFICSIGGIVSTIEITNIIRTIYEGSYNFGNSIFTFFIAFSLTFLISMVCLGFLNLIKAIKHIYLNIELLNSKTEKILDFCNIK